MEMHQLRYFVAVARRSLNSVPPRRIIALTMSRQRKSSRCVAALAKFIRDYRQKKDLPKETE
jgi:hypothetical protein